MNTQTSIIQHGRQATFELKEIEKLNGSCWRQFQLLRRNHKGQCNHIWHFELNSETQRWTPGVWSHLRHLHPQILKWIEQEISKCSEA